MVYGFIIANVVWLGIDAVVNQEDSVHDSTPTWLRDSHVSKSSSK